MLYCEEKASWKIWEKQYSFYNHSIYPNSPGCIKTIERYLWGELVLLFLDRKKSSWKKASFSKKLEARDGPWKHQCLPRIFFMKRASMRKASMSLQIWAFLITTGYSARSTITPWSITVWQEHPRWSYQLGCQPPPAHSGQECCILQAGL